MTAAMAGSVASLCRRAMAAEGVGALGGAEGLGGMTLKDPKKCLPAGAPRTCAMHTTHILCSASISMQHAVANMHTRKHMPNSPQLLAGQCRCCATTQIHHQARPSCSCVYRLILTCATATTCCCAASCCPACLIVKVRQPQGCLCCLRGFQRLHVCGLWVCGVRKQHVYFFMCRHSCCLCCAITWASHVHAPC